MGIDIDRFPWAKKPQSLSEEVMGLATVIQNSYGYKIERYTDHVGKNGRKKEYFGDSHNQPEYANQKPSVICHGYIVQSFLQLFSKRLGDLI